MMNMLKIFSLIILIGGGSSNLLADTVSWDPPTEREDNTLLAPNEIAGYNLYNELGTKYNTNIITDTSFIIDRTSTVQRVFGTAVDTDGRESALSMEVQIPKLIARPKPMMNMRVTP